MEGMKRLKQTHEWMDNGGQGGPWFGSNEKPTGQ